MRYALIITLGVCYWLGWLPPSLVVPALMAVSLLRVPSRSGGPTPRRGGYIAPQPSVSSGESQGTVARVTTYTGSLTPPGNPLADVRAAFKPLAGPSRTIALGSYMSAWGFAPGHLTTAAERMSPELRARVQQVAADQFPWMRPPGDCGCGDTAA